MSHKAMGKDCLLRLSNHGERDCDASAHTHRYSTWGKRKKPASMRTEKEDALMSRRKGLVSNARQDESALNIAAAASPAMKIIDLSDKELELEDMAVEGRSASESLQGEVPALLGPQSLLLSRSKRARALEEEKCRMKGEVERWQTLYSEMAIRISKEKAHCEAAAAAEKRRFEAEKGQLEEKRLKIFEAKIHEYHEYCNRLEEEARERLDAEKARVAEETRRDSKICQICLDRPRNTVIMPCSHGQYCGECLEVLRRTGNPCPSCRGPIAGTVPYKA